MTEFIAQLLWVAVGECHEQRWPLSSSESAELIAAQDELEEVWGRS